MDRQTKSQVALHKKLNASEGCAIGRKLSVEPGKGIQNLPLTGYRLYEPFTKSPREGYFMYPIRDKAVKQILNTKQG